jgi:hypothetical protein
MGAALGTGSAPVALSQVELREPIDFGRADVAKRYVVHGVWLPDGEGCWIAGREARLVLGLPRLVEAPLVLALCADGFLTDRRRQRLFVTVNERPVAGVWMDAARPNLRDERIVVPWEALKGRRGLNLVLRTPDAASPAELGLDDDDRRISVFLRRMVLRQPPILRVGSAVRLGEDAHDEDMLGGGWGDPEPFGRWTQGSRADLLVRLDDSPAARGLEFEAFPFIGRDGRRLQVDVWANGRHLGRVDYERATPSVERVPLGASAAAANGSLLLTWKIRNPASPAELGVSPDPRKLGLFLRHLAVVGD